MDTTTTIIIAVVAVAGVAAVAILTRPKPVPLSPLQQIAGGVGGLLGIGKRAPAPAPIAADA